MKVTELAQHSANFTATRRFLQEKGILRRTNPTCGDCDQSMTEIKCTTSKDQYIYRCPRHKGRKVSIRSDSFLENHNISLQEFLHLIYFWSYETSVIASVEMIGLSEKTVIQWYSYFRDICSHHLVRHPEQIGGIGQIVEIDESVVARRKYHLGHRVPERWVFGGINPSDNKGFLVMVPNRSAETLLPLIERHIAPGSIICSDQWASYNNITSIDVSPPYEHRTVNHSENFVNPADGTTTNHIECMWKNCKRKFKTMNGIQSTMLTSHLDEFIWRQRYGKTHKDAFEHILSHLSEWYVVS